MLFLLYTRNRIFDHPIGRPLSRRGYERDERGSSSSSSRERTREKHVLPSILGFYEQSRELGLVGRAVREPSSRDEKKRNSLRFRAFASAFALFLCLWPSRVDAYQSIREDIKNTYSKVERKTKGYRVWKQLPFTPWFTRKIRASPRSRSYSSVCVCVYAR